MSLGSFSKRSLSRASKINELVALYKSMMRFLLTNLLLLLLFQVSAVSAQNFNGQWKGHFKVYGTDDEDEYMLELQTSDPLHVTGFSYTYFSELGHHYFTICRLSGVINRASHTVTVTELEKIKGNTPRGIRDCLQVHTLTYFKDETGETLEGSWKPAPGFDYGCGAGITLLSRKMLVKTTHHADSAAARKARAPLAKAPSARTGTPLAKAPSARTGTPSAKAGASGAAPSAKTGAAADPKSSATATHKTAPGSATAAGKPATAAKSTAAAKPSRPPKPSGPTLHRDTTSLPSQPSAAAPPVASSAITPLPPAVRRRTNDVIQTIDISTPDIKIELYDDGVIDHDTVTVYFNGKAVVWKNMLSHHPITVTLHALPDRDNDLILYADNLGDIPPNTALMIVYVGDQKYDVRVTSDEQKNGEVRFRLKEGK